jgi:hypothetical protein
MNRQGSWWKDAQVLTERVAGCQYALDRMATFGRGYAGEVVRVTAIRDSAAANLDRIMALCADALVSEAMTVLGPVNGERS